MMPRALFIGIATLLVAGCQTATDRQFGDLQTILEYEAQR
jgi:uncharacterized lipoprotein YajG